MGYLGLPTFFFPFSQGPLPLPTPDNPHPSPFGHRYYYALTDTVTSGIEGSEEGSMEFLAFWVRATAPPSLSAFLLCRCSATAASHSLPALLLGRFPLGQKRQ